MTLTKKDTASKEFIDREASAKREVPSEMDDNLGHKRVNEKTRNDCDCAVQNTWVDNREILNNRSFKNSSSKRGSKREMSTKKLKIEDIKVSEVWVW